MKPGTIVVVLPLSLCPGTYLAYDGEIHDIKWLPVDNGSTLYVIRGVYEVDGIPSCTLEEGIIGKSIPGGGELGLNMKFVREVQPPEEISIQISVDKMIEEVTPCELV